MWHINSFWTEQIGFMASKQPVLALKQEACKAHGKSNHTQAIIWTSSQIKEFPLSCIEFQ